MSLDYSKRQNVTIDEFRKCVEYCFSKLNLLRDDLQRGNPINKEACKSITKGNPSQYIPHNLELFVWKQMNNIEEIVDSATCYCGKLGLFDTSHLSYSSCCQEHSKENRIKKSEKATIKKYGVAYNLQNKTTREKTLEKWNGKSPFSNKAIQEKAHNTIKEKYGVNNAMQDKSICEKSRNTRLKIYGTERANPEKAKTTMKERYGVDYFPQSEEFKELWKDKEFVNNAKRKEIETKRKNNSFHTSKDEETVYELLLTKFSKDDIERQYKDKRYGNYVCDFYIKSTDTFIEYHGHWSHGGMPFDSSNPKCIEQLNDWKIKAFDFDITKPKTNYYLINIECWTKKDVEKRNLAKQNNFSFYEFFDINQVKTWLNSL